MPRRNYLSEEKTLQLINEVKNRPCLWNPEYESYNEKYSLAKAWADISMITELPISFLKSKWKNLRDTYKKELKKCNGEYTGTWHYYDQLKFLVFKKDTNDNDAADDQGDKETEGSDDGESEVKCEPIEPNEEYWSEEDPIPEKMRKVTEEDFDAMFLQSLTPYFRQLGPMRQLVVRNKMQEMLLNELAAQHAKKRTGKT